MLKRAGTSLIELIVALAMSALVFAAATSSLLQQQRSALRVRTTNSADAQLRSATNLLAHELAHLDPAAGDIALGEARDTSIQLRATIAAGISCNLDVAAATIRTDSASQVALAGNASTPRVSDTLWWRADTGWAARRIASIGPAPASCTSGGAAPSQRLLVGGADTIAAGTPLRITRQTRYAIYRASDGTWQLGFREWNDPTSQFAPPQPVAGPFLPSSPRLRTGLRYFDSTGTELGRSAPVNTRDIARARITALSLLPALDRARDSILAESLDVALRHPDAP